jgi:cytochrome c-type biogenesis protein CcmE
MTGSRLIGIGCALGVLLVGAGYSGRFTTRKQPPYQHVDQVVAAPEAWNGRQIDLHGFAREIQRGPGATEYRFRVEWQGKSTAVPYDGAVPDSFEDGVEVVLKGTMTPSGFRARKSGVLVKVKGPPII